MMLPLPYCTYGTMIQRHGQCQVCTTHSFGSFDHEYLSVFNLNSRPGLSHAFQPSLCTGHMYIIPHTFTPIFDTELSTSFRTSVGLTTLPLALLRVLQDSFFKTHRYSFVARLVYVYTIIIARLLLLSRFHRLFFQILELRMAFNQDP